MFQLFTLKLPSAPKSTIAADTKNRNNVNMLDRRFNIVAPQPGHRPRFAYSTCPRGQLGSLKSSEMRPASVSRCRRRHRKWPDQSGSVTGKVRSAELSGRASSSTIAGGSPMVTHWASRILRQVGAKATQRPMPASCSARRSRTFPSKTGSNCSPPMSGDRLTNIERSLLGSDHVGGRERSSP